jgi:hypothetical protein
MTNEKKWGLCYCRGSGDGIDKKSWIMFLIFIAFLTIFVCIHNFIRKKDIEHNFSTVCGKITSYGKTSRGARAISFKYHHNTEEYKGGTGIGYFKDCDKTGWCLGKCYIVEYSSKHPKNSRMLFDKPCDCDSIKIDNQ